MNKNILIASNAGIYEDGINFDIYLYDLFERNGLNPIITICDGVMSACQMSKFPRVKPEILANEGQNNLCKKCYKCGLEKIGKRKHIKLSDFDIENNELIKNNEEALEEKKIIEHAKAGTIRYFASTNLNDEKYSSEIFNKYIDSSRIIEKIYKNILNTFKPLKIIAHHGIYVPQGIITDLAEKFNIPIVIWIKSYRLNTYLFSWNKSYHFTMQGNLANWDKFNFTDQSVKIAKDYLIERKKGKNDSIHFNRNPIEIKLPKKNKKRFLLLTSVFWDAQLHYDNMLFGSQKNWISETIKFFKKNNKYELIIRIHPAEVTGFIASREPALNIVKESLADYSYHTEPGKSNIWVVEASNRISTYDLISQSDSVLVYNTKTAIEAAAMGKPVIVAGDSWIRGKGFDNTPRDEYDYFNYIENENLIKNNQYLALKFFYYFYFKRMFEFNIKDINKEPFVENNNYESKLLHCFLKNEEFVFNYEAFIVKNQNLLNICNVLEGPYKSVTTLKTLSDIELCQTILAKMGVEKHHDFTKDWDLYGFILHVIKNYHQESVILDAGSGSKAALANRLIKLGYRNIHAIDLKNNLEKKYEDKNLIYRCGDLTNTKYENEKFDAILMLSVIEHIENYTNVIDEMSRILKLNGTLIISTDYWFEKIDCSNIYPYGNKSPEMKIFSYEEIVELIKYAKSKNLYLDSNFDDYIVQDKVCEWKRVNRKYTFIRLTFKKINSND